MDNLKELSVKELREIEGGATFAYRCGQAVRYIGFCFLLGSEHADRMV